MVSKAEAVSASRSSQPAGEDTGMCVVKSSGKCCEGEVQLAYKESYRGLDLVWKIWESFPEEVTLELRPEG